MAERLNTIVDRVLSGLLGDAEHAEKQRPPLMLDMLSDWLPYRVYDPASRLYFNARSKGFILSVTPLIGADERTGEILGAFVENALNAGALDVFYAPIQMKKNRPAVLLTVLCAEGEADRFSEMILRETTAFGVRQTVAARRKLRREFTEAATPHGKVAVKIGRLGVKVVQVAPEFESVKKTAAKAGVPVKQVFNAAVQAAKNVK